MEQETTVWPVYLAIDTSGSTRRCGLISALNDALPHIIEGLEARQSFQLSVRFCLVSWNTEATVLVGLSELSTLEGIPELVPGGFSSLASALRRLRADVEFDLGQLAADGVKHKRPACILLADGLPTDRHENLLEGCSILVGTRNAGSPFVHLVTTTRIDPLAIAAFGFDGATSVHESIGLADTSIRIAGVILGALDRELQVP